MKNVTLFLVSLGIIVLSQKSYAQQEFKSTPSSLVKEKKAAVDKFLNKYEVFTLDHQQVNQLAKNKEKGITLTLAINDVYRWNLVLEENDLRAPEYKSVITTEEGETVQEKEECHTYKGYANGDTTQQVRLTINKNELKGFIKQNDQFVVIKPARDFFTNDEKIVNKNSEKVNNKLLVAYQQKDAKKIDGSGCGVTEAMEREFLDRIEKRKNNNSSSRIDRQNFITIDMATDADGEWFGIHGANSNAEILTVLNQVEGVYWDRFRARILVTFQHVFNNAATDPYTTAPLDGLGLINQLRTEWQNNREGYSVTWYISFPVE